MPLRPYVLQPARLLWSWDSPDKNTGVGCCFLLQGIFPTQGSNPQPLTSPVLAGELFTACATWEVWATITVLVYTSQHLFSTLVVVSFQWVFFFKLINFLSPQKWGLLSSTVSGEQPGRFSGVVLNGCFCFVLFFYEIKPRPRYANQQQALTHQRAEAPGQKEPALTGGGISTWKIPI